MILSHRGVWSSKVSQNSVTSFKEASKAGFGIELDVRDFMGELVVSHDVPVGKPPSFRHVLEELKCVNFSGHLAINVKSDGLISLLADLELLSEFKHFFFDMTIPELRHYKSADMKFAVRVSELEDISVSRRLLGADPIFWLDSFYSDWWLDLDWDQMFDVGETVFVVSPELHGRKPQVVWGKVVSWILEGRNVGICTDFPEKFLEHQRIS